MTKWITVGCLDDIPPLGARIVQMPGLDIALFRAADGRIFALEDRCPHRNGPLSQGMVHGTRVTCPLHDWRIDLDSGEAVAPDQGCVRTFPVRVGDGVIELDIGPAALGASAAE